MNAMAAKGAELLPDEVDRHRREFAERCVVDANHPHVSSTRPPAATSVFSTAAACWSDLARRTIYT